MWNSNHYGVKITKRESVVFWLTYYEERGIRICHELCYVLIKKDGGIPDSL